MFHFFRRSPRYSTILSLFLTCYTRLLAYRVQTLSFQPQISMKRSLTLSESTLTETKLQQRGLKILEILNRYYPNPPIPLDHRNDFTFLVAVVLSAQTTDGKVNEVTKELFALADTPEKMSKLDVSQIQRIIQPVGLAPRKAQYVSSLSKMLIEKFEGKIPNTYEGLESLPGVGHKTASVIMSQLFGQNSLAVDTHVHRLALRWGLTKEQRNVDKVQLDLCRIFPEPLWNKAHLQMIYFGREYCSAKNHSNAECPICSWIHQEDKRPQTPEDFSRFSPRKKAKGLVYYNERVTELHQNPSLAVFSSTTTTTAIAEGSVSAQLSFEGVNEAKEVKAEKEEKKTEEQVKNEVKTIYRTTRRLIRRTNTK